MVLIRPSTGCFLIVTWFSIFYLVLGTPKNVYLLDKSVILSPSIYLSNGKCNLVITEIRFSAFYLINFVLVKMINIFSYNKGNFVATRSHRSWFILFEKIRSDHPNWYGELFRVCSRLNCLPIWYLLNCIKRISLLLIPNWVRPLLLVS